MIKPFLKLNTNYDRPGMGCQHKSGPAQAGIRKEPIGRPSLILNFEVKKIKMKKHLRRKGDTHAD